MKTFTILFFCLLFASFQSRANLLSSLQQEKKVLLQKNISLKNKNLDLKKQKQKLKKVIKRLGVATGIFAGTTAGTFIAGGIAKNKKNEKNTDAENIIKKLQDPKKIIISDIIVIQDTISGHVFKTKAQLNLLTQEELIRYKETIIKLKENQSCRL